MREKTEKSDISILRSKAKAIGIIGWKILDREDLEFFIREFGKTGHSPHGN